MSLAQPEKPLAVTLAHVLALAHAPVRHSACLRRILNNLSHTHSHTYSNSHTHRSHSHLCDIVHGFGAARVTS